MPKRKYPPEIREQAIMLSAGQTATAAAESLGPSSRTIERWVSSTDPGTLAKYVAAKRALAQRVVLERTEAAVTHIMDQLAGDDELNHYQAKALQARAVALGIMDDHYGGRQNPNSSTRFGTRDSLLDGWTEHDRVTLERIERVTLEPTTQPASSEG